MKKLIRSFVAFISGSKAIFPLEHRLFNLASFFISTFAFIAVFINYLLGLQLQTIWLSFVGVLVSLSLYYLARFRYYFSAVLIFSYLLVALIILGSMYFYNNGMHGTTIYVFLMLLNILVLITPRRFQYTVFGVLYAGIVVLMGLEYYNPGWVVPYHSREEKMLDHLICLFYSMIFTTGTIISFRKSYYVERGRTMRRNHELKELNAQMAMQKIALEEAVLLANKRRDNIEILLNELNHRVKNNLQVVSSLLNLQANSVSDPTAKRAILESKNRLSSMILVHKRLYHNENTTEIFMPDYLQELSESVMRTYHGELNEKMVSYAVDPVWLKVEQAIPVGLISNELITNCFKHCINKENGRRISIKLGKSGEQHLLSVSDDGDGFTDNGDSKSFGLQLVKSLVMQLNGTYKLTSERGTCWEIFFN